MFRLRVDVVHGESVRCVGKLIVGSSFVHLVHRMLEAISIGTVSKAM